MIFLHDRVENIMGKGENGGYSIFSFSHNLFKRLLFLTRKNQGLFGKGLTAKVISWRSVTHMCFLAFSHQYQHNFSFQSHRLLFSHASAEVRGENVQERKFATTGDQTHNRQGRKMMQKGENTLYKIFHRFLQCFQPSFFSRLSKHRTVW